MRAFSMFCLAAPFALYFLPYNWVLTGAGALAVAAAIPVIFSRDAADAPHRLFISTTAFFAAIAVNRHQPMFAYAVLALWGAGRILNPNGLSGNAARVRFAAVWIAVFAPLALAAYNGGIGFFGAAFGALFMAVVAGLVSRRIVRGSRGMTGEAVAAALMAVLFSLRQENLSFLNSPLLGIVYGILCGLFFSRFGLLDRLGALVLAFCGATMFIAAGRELFLFYLFFFGVFEMGKRLPRWYSESSAASYWAQRSFIAISLGGAATAVLSAGASDPFPFFFAIAGAFSAAVFSSWTGWGEYRLRQVLLGFWGSSLLAACGWLSSVYSAGAAPLVMFAGFAAAGAYHFRGMLASPEKDQVWLEYACGALAGILLFKVLAGYLA